MGAPVWLAVMTLLFTNAVWHLAASVKSRTYSPGVVTGLLLYVPLTIYGYGLFLRTGHVSVPTALIACAVGASYHLWVGKALHQWRVNRASR